MRDDHGQRFLDRVFTPDEQAYCLKMSFPTPHLAGRFAAKEAVLKMLGTGLAAGIAWTDVEVRADASGAPHVTLHGAALTRAESRGISATLISISHTEQHAIASAIGIGA